MKIGFDNGKYLKIQSEHIKERIAQFGDKLYLEFGGKLYDDFHASRVLPGFQPDSKLRMLTQLQDDAEIVIVINAEDIEKGKVRGDLGLTYADEVLRLRDIFVERGFLVNGVAITDIKGALPTYALTDPKIFVLSNTDRYTLLSVWDWVFPLGETQSQLTGYELPYWERAAQITVTRVFYDMVMIFVGFILLIIGGIMVFLRFRKPKPVEEAAEEAKDKTEEEIKLLEEQTK